MYVGQFDSILDNTLNDFYEHIIASNKLKDTIGISDIVSKQNNIIKNLYEYLISIDLKNVKEIVTDNNHSKMLIDTLRRYVAYYLFMIIGYFYTGTFDAFKNNVVEISKNYDRQKLDIPGFFTGESNASIFSLTEIALHVYDIVENKSKPPKIPQQSYIDASKLLESLGDDFSKTHLKINPKQKDKLLQAHNICKTVLLQTLYINVDKHEITKMLENASISTGESIYISIVVPTEKSIDIIDIESMLTQEEIDQGVANNIYDIIGKGELAYQQQIQTTESKILDLINSGFLIPISEDFLLYHRDSEKYDNILSISHDKSKDTLRDKSKRDGLRIKYILDKINSVENYYSAESDEEKKKSKENLYAPLANRFAVAINELEDLKIINKSLSYSKGTTDNEYFNELISYRKYPYINFKNFSKNGFPFLFNKTKAVVRGVSFEKEGEHRQSPRNPLQLRVGSSEQQVNIIGFMLNSTKSALECINVGGIKNITTDYDDFLGAISKRILTGGKESIAWKIDLSKSGTEIKTYEKFDVSEQMEQCKLICANMRDEIVDVICQKIINVLNGYSELSFYDASKIINAIINATLPISEDEPKFIEVKKAIYYKIYEKYTPQYDKKDDEIHGIFGEILPIPYVKKPHIDAKLDIHLTFDKTKVTAIDETEISNVVCHHYIAWDKIMLSRKENGNKYTDALYEFMQLYVIENEEHDYVCRSCGAVLLNIKKYVSDGTFDEASQRFIAFSIPMDVPLEDMPEYKRYNIAIRNIDRLIDKIATIINIPYLTGSSLTQKINRNVIVKDTIDLTLINNTLLRKGNLKERNDMASRKYGINRDLSNLFVFDLDNSIFVYTSKEKDYYKYVKHNNIVAYIVFLILLELSESHISYLSMDKLCNYNSFERFGNKVLEGLKIRTNNKGDVKNIAEYPVLSYLIYVATCILSKYTIWYTINFDEKKQLTKSTGVAQQKASTVKKVDPMKQKIMVHTIVDIMNCVMDYAENNKTKHIYEVVYTKFYQKLPTTYSNNVIMTQLKNESIRNLPQYTKVIKIEQVNPISLIKPFELTKYDATVYDKYAMAKYYAKNHELKIQDISSSNIYYCKDGNFHKWVSIASSTNGFTMKCSLCDVILENVEYDEKLTKIIKENIRLRYLEKLCNKYCLSGDLHMFELRDSGDNKIVQICRHCDYVYGKYPPRDKLEELYAIVTDPKIMKRQLLLDKKWEKQEAFANNIIQSLKKKYVDSKTHRDDYYKFIEQFVNTLQQNIGDTIKIGDETIHLKDDVYVIDHNHMGFPIEPPLIISEHSDLISFKKDNKFFGRDVISYNTGKAPKIEVFYDMYTYILLGYKEFNKDYVLHTKTENKIKLEYSLLNQIKYLGNTLRYIDVTKYGDPKTDEQLINKVVSNVSSERIEKLGNIIYKFMVYINLIKTKYKPTLHPSQISETEQINLDEYLPLLDASKYYHKLNGIVVKTEDTKLFKLWKIIVQNIHYKEQPMKKINIDMKENIINVDDIHNNDYSGNLMLFYFISEITSLLNMNKNKIVKQNLIQFIVEFIHIMFKEYNTDYLEFMTELQRFICMLNSSEYYKKMEEKGFGMDEYTTGIYGEYTDPSDVKSKEQLEAEEEDKEAEESMDIDGEVDAEDEYDNAYTDRELNWGAPLRWETRTRDPFEK